MQAWKVRIMEMKVPLLDLKRQYKYIKTEVQAKLNEICEAQTFILGAHVEKLESEISKYCETPYAVGVASGTDALILALDLAGIGQGDEVITTPFTFFATVSAITRLGAKPVFADIKPDTFNIDADRIEEKITKKTKAILPVHLFGQAADMDFITEIAEKNSLKIIEDCAQAIGSKYKGRKVGSIGSAGAFSFFPSKNLGAFGDGGIITVREEGDAKKLKSMRMHGESVKYYHDFIGYNSRLDALQAAVLSIKMKYLGNWHEQRREHARTYAKFLDGAGDIVIPYESSVNYHIYNQYTIRSGRRDALKAFLDDNKIGCAIYYPVPLHLQKCFAYLGYKKGDFPEAEKAAAEVLSLPVFPELTEDEIGYVAGKIIEFFKGAK